MLVFFTKGGVTGNDLESNEISKLASGLYTGCLFSDKNSKPLVLKFVK
jgi:hypothetical protein